MFKKLISRWKAPTPKMWRRIGNAILATGLFISGGAFMEFDKLEKIFTANEIKIVIISALILGVVGKFVSSLATEENAS